MNKSLFVLLLLAVSIRNSYVEAFRIEALLGASTRVTTSSTVTTRRPTTYSQATPKAGLPSYYANRDEQVGNYGDMRVVGSVMGKQKQKSVQRYASSQTAPTPKAGLPSYYEIRDEQVGNYGNMRVVGSVMGKKKQKSVQRYASSQTTPPEAGLPSYYANRDEQVGNYGEKRVVGNVVGKQKQVSLQRYDPKYAEEGSQTAPPALPAPAGLSSYFAFKDDQKLGNYREERVIGSVVESTVVDWPRGAICESVREPEENDGTRHGSYLDALGGSDSRHIKNSYSPFGASKPIASTSVNSLYTSPTTESNAPVEGNAAIIPSYYASRDDQLDNYGDMRAVGSVVGTQTHKSIQEYGQKHSGDAQAAPPPVGLPSYARKDNQVFGLPSFYAHRDEQVGNYGEKRVVGNVVGKQKHIYLQRYEGREEEEKRARREAEEKARLTNYSSCHQLANYAYLYSKQR